MEDLVLEHAARGLRRRLLSPVRIEGTDRLGERAFALIVDDGGRRSRLVFDVDPTHATLHFEPVPKREEWRGGFGQRLRGAFLVDARPVPGDRRIEIDIAVRTIEPTFQLQVAWHGRGGNLWLLDLARDDGDPGGVPKVAERLVEVGAGPDEPWSAPEPDPRPGPASEELAEVAESVLATTPPQKWLRELSRRVAVSRPTLWQGLTDAQRRGEGDQTPATIAARLAEELRRPRSVSSHAYRLAPSTPLALPDTEPMTAERWGLPTGWVSIGAHAALSDSEVDVLADPGGSGDPAEDSGRLFWLLSRTHRFLLLAEADSRRRQAYRTRFAGDLRRISRIGDRLRGELSDEEGPRLRSWGEAILSHLHEVTRGDDLLVCPNLQDPDGPELRIPLDPSRSATDAAESYFKRARRWEKGKEMRETRLSHVERALARVTELSSEIESAEELPPHDAIEEKLREATGPFYRGPQADPAERLAGARATGRTQSKVSGGRGAGPGPARSTGKPDSGRDRRDVKRGAGGSGVSKQRRAGRDPNSRFRPRVYKTSEGWTVVVGRSNQENDYVTMKVGKQDDYWFHAHGCPGSHVILKREGRKDNPSRKTIEEAASIAAFYSKARNSKRAPVIYTLKKYVTKPRKAKAGLVTCTRESSIMVRPVNPEPDTPPEWGD